VAAREILKERERWRRAGLLLSAEAILAVQGAYDKEEAQLGPRHQVLQDCIKRLPPHSLRLLELRYQEELPIQSVAGQVRGSVEAVTKTLSRIRTALEECIEQTLVRIDEART
jgi:DNA-directed RNA polymerase specialized sigma24 family protein